MGPRHLSRGIQLVDQEPIARESGFNGATASEPWNQQLKAFAANLHDASMGPRHLSRGIVEQSYHVTL